MCSKRRTTLDISLIRSIETASDEYQHQLTFKS